MFSYQNIFRNTVQAPLVDKNTHRIHNNFLTKCHLIFTHKPLNSHDDTQSKHLEQDLNYNLSMSNLFPCIDYALLKSPTYFGHTGLQDFIHRNITAPPVRHLKNQL